MSDLSSDGQPIGVRNEESLVIPVIEERLDIAKDIVTTGIVRIEKSVREHDVLVSEPFNFETVHVERIPVNSFVESPPPVRSEGDVTIIPVLEEVLVTTKRLRLVEEVRITKVRSASIYQENATLRYEEVTVDRQPSQTSDEAGEERLD